MRQRLDWTGRRGAAMAVAAALMMAGCGAGSAAPTTGGATSVAAPPTEVPATAPPATSGSAGGTVSVYSMPDGRWSEGTVHVEITGGIEATFDLPQSMGETAAGRTTITFEHHDPADSRWSLGLVRLSFFPDADSIGVEAGGIVIIGPCDVAFGTVTADGFDGQVSCSEDLQAQFEGDPREVSITGSFSTAR